MNENMVIETTLHGLIVLEKKHPDDRVTLDRIDEMHRELLSQYKDNNFLLIAYNQFRIRNLKNLSFVRPQVLIGWMSYNSFPNFHCIALLKMADVISLAPIDSENQIDRVPWEPLFDTIFDILDKLPDGFSPDLFFDNQIDGQHFIPKLLESAPFPTVAGLCHMYMYNVIKPATKLFDFVMPLSTPFIPYIKKLGHAHVLNLPFGLNWASFHHVIPVSKQKDIDISITFQAADLPRKKTHELLYAFTKKHDNKYKIFIADHRLEKDEYLEILQRSRISINVVGVHGPYNYRTCEIINSGAVLFQHNNINHPVQTHLSAYLTEGEHYFDFDEFNFEEKLLALLDGTIDLNKTSAAAQKKLTEEYSYEKLYTRLFEELCRVRVDGSNRISQEEGLFQLGRLYWGHQKPQLRIGSLMMIDSISQQERELQYVNLLGIIPSTFSILSPEETSTILEFDNALSSRCLNGGYWQLVTYLHSHTSGSVIAIWNYIIATLELGKLDITACHNLLDKIKNADTHDIVDDEKYIINLCIPNQHKEIWPSETQSKIELELLISENQESKSKIYMDFIVKTCERIIDIYTVPVIA